MMIIKGSQNITRAKTRRSSVHAGAGVGAGVDVGASVVVDELGASVVVPLAKLLSTATGNVISPHQDMALMYC